MELVPAPELDLKVEDSTVVPATMLVPTDDAERRVLRGLIGAIIEPYTSVRFGRKGERSHIEVDNNFRSVATKEVEWPEDERWRGWCVSDLSSLDLDVAVRLVDVGAEACLQYALLEPEFWKEMYRDEPMPLWSRNVRLYIPEEIAAVSA